MPDSAYAAFIEDCRQERAHLIGLIEALEGKRINPGAPIAVPETMQAVTAATLLGLQAAVAQLNDLLEAYGKSGS
jgi:hypothetical protein